MAAPGACSGLSVDLRNAFHMSITASLICLLFFGPSHVKNSSMLCSERS